MLRPKRFSHAKKRLGLSVSHKGGNMSKRIVASFISGLMGAGIFLLLGASGDLIYPDTKTNWITGVQAANLADEFIALGSWDGDRADMIFCIVERADDGPTNFRTTCRGEKSAAPSALTYPLEIIGVVP